MRPWVFAPGADAPSAANVRLRPCLIRWPARPPAPGGWRMRRMPFNHCWTVACKARAPVPYIVIYRPPYRPAVRLPHGSCCRRRFWFGLPAAVRSCWPPPGSGMAVSGAAGPPHRQIRFPFDSKIMKARSGKSSHGEVQKNKDLKTTADQLAQCVQSRAYEIWESQGCPHGCDQEHWLQAEREVILILG